MVGGMICNVEWTNTLISYAWWLLCYLPLPLQDYEWCTWQFDDEKNSRFTCNEYTFYP